MHADGAKATGFKSMVVAQFTGVSLQKDDNAFIKWNGSAYGAGGDTDGKMHLLIFRTLAVNILKFPLRAKGNKIVQMMLLYRAYT